VDEAAKISVGCPDQPSHEAFWPQGWWRILDFKIGIVPLPVYFVLVGLIFAFIQIGNGKIGSDLLTSIAILARLSLLTVDSGIFSRRGEGK